MKSSSDVVGAVMKELRLQSGQPGSNFRLAVAVDGVNALWGRSTIKKEDKSFVRGRLTHPSRPSLRQQQAQKSSRVSLFCSVSGGSRGADPGLQPTEADEERLGECDEKKLTLKMIIITGFNHLNNFFVFLKAGGAIITTLSQTGSLYTSRLEYLPQELLGEVRNHFSIIFIVK